MRPHPALTTALLGVVLAAASVSARAETHDDMSFSGMFKIDRIDANKDGMVSKAEFIAMMGRVWDMKAKEMKVQGDRMKEADYMALMGFLSRGEKNK